MTAPHFTATADYNAVVKELQKVQAANQKLENQINRQSTTSRKRARSFSSEMKTQIGSIVAGWATLQGATRLVGDAIQYVRDESLEAIDAIKGMEEGFKQFMQIATSAKDASKMEETTLALGAKYGEQLPKIQKTLFAMRSTGVADSLQQVVKFGDIIDIEAQARVAGLAGEGQLMGGQIAPMELVSAGLVAAQRSPEAFEGLLVKALPMLAETGMPAGMKPEELLGIAAVGAGQFKSGEVAGTRFKALFAKMQQGGLSGMSGLMELAAMDDAGVEGVLGGNVEAKAALDAFKSQQSAYLGRIREIGAERTAYRQQGGPVAMMQAYRQAYDLSLATDPQSRESMERRRAAEQLRISEVRHEATLIGGRSTEALLEEAAVFDAKTEQLAGGALPWERWATARGAETGRGFGAGGVRAGASIGEDLSDWRVWAVNAGTAGMGSTYYSIYMGVKAAMEASDDRSGQSADAAATIAGQRQR